MKVFLCTEENTFNYLNSVDLSTLDTNFRGFRR